MALQSTSIPLFVLLVSTQLHPSISLPPSRRCRHRICLSHAVPRDGRPPSPFRSHTPGGDGSCRPPASVISRRRPWGTSARKGVASLGARSQKHGGDAPREVHNRRSFLARSAVISTASLGMAVLPTTTIAGARGLQRFPCKSPLMNKYHFLRSGTSLLEEDNVISTNPLFLTNREAALSELGQEQVRGACRLLAAAGTAPTIVRYSLAAASSDSANIVGEELKIGRDRLVPEFNFMDPRAIGGWDFGALNATEAAVWALDADEAGTYGKDGKPPPNEDGTPNEALADAVVRLTNLMSVLETLYSGDTLLLVFPDGTGPALLSCLIGGVPLNRVHEFQYGPGELRYVDYDAVEALASRPPSQTYLDAVARGRVELQQRLENPDMLRNVQDLEYERDRAQETQKREAQRQEALLESRREEEMRKEEAEVKEAERQRKRKEMEEEKKQQEAKQKEEAKAKESERQKEREDIRRKKKEEEAKQKEELMVMKLEKDRKGGDITQGSDTTQSSLDAKSIGIFATLTGGVAVISSSSLETDENGEMADGGNNTDSSLALLAPPVDQEEGVSSNNVGSDETVGTRNVENKATDEDHPTLPDKSLEGPTNSGENNATDAHDVIGADETVGTTDGGNNDSSESSALSSSSLPRVVDPTVEDDRVSADNVLEIPGDGGGINETDANATAPVADDGPPLITDSVGDPTDGTDDAASDSPAPQTGIDYDDWEDAWLGSISEIMNDSTEG